MDFPTYKQAWQEGRIAPKHSYQVERDYWEWEATVTDEQRLREILESLAWPLPNPMSFAEFMAEIEQQ